MLMLYLRLLNQIVAPPPPRPVGWVPSSNEAIVEYSNLYSRWSSETVRRTHYLLLPLLWSESLKAHLQSPSGPQAVATTHYPIG